MVYNKKRFDQETQTVAYPLFTKILRDSPFVLIRLINRGTEIRLVSIITIYANGPRANGVVIEWALL